MDCMIRPAALAISLLAFAHSSAHAAACDQLTALTLPKASVVSASAVPPGPFSSGGRGGAPDLPAFCRVQAVARPVAGSEIHLEVWLPQAEAWNGKFLGTGNGGYSSALSYADMGSALRRGYAVAGSDTGHEGGDLKFGAGHPEKIDDWGWRAVHVMTETAKAVVLGYYARAAAHSYFTGCSTGGHQALSEAQRFPADYDGIVAGAPGNNRVRLNVGFLWSWLALQQGAEPLASKLQLIQQAALATCDTVDGTRDGIIADPRACRFDPSVLDCHGPDSQNCLTAAQVAAVRKIYDGARNPRTGEQIFPGWARGSEAGWTAYFVGQPEPARLDFWRYWVFDDPNWNPRTFDFDRDVARADSKMAAVAATSANLAPFQKRGGRLIMYNGTADPVVPPEDGIRYYQSVQRAMGGPANTAAFFRYFLVPGMSHCGGGTGPNAFDALGALDRWVTDGTAPAQILATHSAAGKVDRSRPLCPFPQTAHWNGVGDIDQAASYSCVASSGN